MSSHKMRPLEVSSSAKALGSMPSCRKRAGRERLGWGRMAAGRAVLQKGGGSGEDARRCAV